MLSMLAGLKVLDLSNGNGYSCGRFLASLGADVVHVEPIDGDPERNPRAPKQLVPHSTSAYWDAQNVGKKSITLDIACLKGREICKRLMNECDFVIETFTPGYLKSLGLDYDCIQSTNPRIIFISITPFGQTGPYAHFKGGELIASAMGGVLDTCGYANDTPVLEALDACTFHACAAASMGAMLAHRERSLSGKGQQVDCSIQEVAASRNTNNLIAYQFDKRKLLRAGNCVRFGVATVRVIWALKDGYCFHSMMTGKFGAPANKALSQWMSESGFANPMSEVDWDTYDRSALPAATRSVWEQAIGEFFLSKTKAEIRDEGYRRGIRATVANSAADVLNDPHLNARQFIQTAQADDQQIQYPAYFIKSSQCDTQLEALISKPGQHNGEVYPQWLQMSDSDIQQLQQEGVI